MLIQVNSIEDSNRTENGRKEEEKTTLERENLQNLEKISQFYKGKFTESDLKWEEEMQNLLVNSTEFASWTENEREKGK